ncbi:hypothetical protein B0H67DRAFT_642423 [Lasiosphaeris hirsuta]|uniref:Uncharacterized protein n=1 Tax=Lasiosphaeris hirsuta TaxID=260670 RepID=A0AA40B1U1_9PEZI|nr:hypothetical protein B0H67DRAFT_642423 [Lasiosphaeris hirsuta]
MAPESHNQAQGPISAGESQVPPQGATGSEVGPRASVADIPRPHARGSARGGKRGGLRIDVPAPEDFLHGSLGMETEGTVASGKVDSPSQPRLVEFVDPSSLRAEICSPEVKWAEMNECLSDSPSPPGHASTCESEKLQSSFSFERRRIPKGSKTSQAIRDFEFN